MRETVTCAECGAEFATTREHAWCSDRCADAAWARMHPNVPVRRPGRHRGNADQLRPRAARTTADPADTTDHPVG